MGTHAKPHRITMFVAGRAGASSHRDLLGVLVRGHGAPAHHT